MNNEAKNTSPLTLLLTDNYSGADSTETLVVEDEKALRNFFQKSIERENRDYQCQKWIFLKIW